MFVMMMYGAWCYETEPRMLPELLKLVCITVPVVGISVFLMMSNARSKLMAVAVFQKPS